jgi:hypothetical protein
MHARRGQVGERWQATPWREGGGGQAGRPSRPATAWRPGVARVLIVRVRFIDFMFRRGRVRLPRIRRLSRTHTGVPLKLLRKAVKDKLHIPLGDASQA